MSEMAAWAEQIMFMKASLLPLSEDLWEPVKTTGLDKFFNINDKAAEVKCMVSVP
jgi:hypothetical protein